MVSSNKKNKHTSVHQTQDAAKKVRQHHKEVKKSLKNVISKKDDPKGHQLKEKIHEGNTKNKLAAKEADRQKLVISIMQNKAPQVEQAEDKSIKDWSRAFIGDIRKLIEESDVMLMILDARDPMGTRSVETEALIKASNKILIFVLNKIDLIPTENMKAWHAYLSREARTFAFKASVQEQARKLGGASGYKPSCDVSAPCASFGVDNLVNYLKSLNKKSSGVSGKSADKLVIGVCGVPNTGKSSVINSLKRKRICEAGNVAGLTRNLQHVGLDNHIMLIDSPGIVLARSSDPAEYALRNCIRVEKIEDPIGAAEAIYKRCDPNQLRCIYKLPHFSNVNEFMLAFATRTCPLKKGGVTDLNVSAIKLINDWTRGKIKYCSQPPAIEGASDEMSFDIDPSTWNDSYQPMEDDVAMGDE